MTRVGLEVSYVMTLVGHLLLEGCRIHEGS